MKNYRKAQLEELRERIAEQDTVSVCDNCHKEKPCVERVVQGERGDFWATVCSEACRLKMCKLPDFAGAEKIFDTVDWFSQPAGGTRVYKRGDRFEALQMGNILGSQTRVWFSVPVTPETESWQEEEWEELSSAVAADPYDWPEDLPPHGLRIISRGILVK